MNSAGNIYRARPIVNIVIVAGKGHHRRRRHRRVHFERLETPKIQASAGARGATSAMAISACPSLWPGMS